MASYGSKMFRMVKTMRKVVMGVLSWAAIFYLTLTIRILLISRRERNSGVDPASKAKQLSIGKRKTILTKSYRLGRTEV